MKNPLNELFKHDLFKANSLFAMTFLCLLAILFQMYVLLLILVITIIVASYKALKQQSVRHIQSVLCSYAWEQHHQVIRSALQYIKYSMMIASGYHSKSNTNIILQEEKDRPQHNQQRQVDEIAKQLGKVIELITKLFSLKRNLMPQDKFSIENNCKHIQVNSFFQLFSASRQVDLFIEDLSKMSLMFKQRFYSPANLLDNSLHINKWKNQMLPALLQLNRQVQRLSKIYNQLFAELVLSEEFKEAYQAAINKNPDQNVIQYLQMFICKCQKLLPVQQIQQEQENQTIQLIFGRDKNEKERGEPVKNQSQQVNVFERKEFLRRLDMQLMIGLARKRQAQL